jgi:hypothetical protein
MYHNNKKDMKIISIIFYNRNQDIYRSKWKAKKNDSHFDEFATYDRPIAVQSYLTALELTSSFLL